MQRRVTASKYSTNAEEWRKLEYEELNRYSRTIYETLFRLAQMTFVLNVGLGGGFSYVCQPTHFRDAFYFGAFITVLTWIYNLGAFCAYIYTHHFLTQVLFKMQRIDLATGGSIFSLLLLFNPPAFAASGNLKTKIWITFKSLRHGSVFALTLTFFLLLIGIWSFALFSLFKFPLAPYPWAGKV